MNKKPLRLSILLIPLLLTLVWTGVVRGSPQSAPAAPAAPRDLVVTIYPSADALIDQANPSQNYGGATYLQAGRSGGADYDVLFAFDLSVLPPDAVVVSASLGLELIYNRGDAGRQDCTLWVDALLSAWNESTVTWNNAPSAASQGDPPTTVPPQLYAYWDVTNAVQGWVEGTLTNYGLRMHGDRSTEIYRQFWSREANSYYPCLIVTYTSAAITPTPTNTPTRTPTNSPTATPPGSGTCPGTVYVLADEDAYVDAEHPYVEYGNLNHHWLRREWVNAQDTQRNLLLHFPIEAMLPPGYYIYQATLKLRVIATQGEAPEPWHALAFALEDPFDETTANWSNQPAMYDCRDIFEISPGAYWHTADLTELVNDWYTGSEPNNGVGIVPAVPLTGDLWVQYWSREYTDPAYRPVLEIQCGDNIPTPTPTPTRTPTRTPTATPTITPTPVPETGNVVAFRLEVTQGLQDLQQSIPLLEGKRTYVRVHYDLENPVPNYIYNTTAKLNIYRAGVWKASVLPINNWNGYLELVDMPWPWVAHNTFIFELPSEYTTGEIKVQAVIDPDAELPESSWGDNLIDRTVSFQPSQGRTFYLYLVKHIAADGTVTQATFNDVAPSWNYTMAALPFADVDMFIRLLEWDEATMGEMDCEGVNGQLLSQWLSEGADWSATYYAVMPGGGTSCAAGIPSAVGSSWTNASRSTMAHELGHCFGRHHSQDPRYDDGGDAYDVGCGAKTGCWYSSFWWGLVFCPDGFEDFPYDDMSVSSSDFDVLGFYNNAYLETGPNHYWTSQFFIPDHSWKDLMTYCKPERWPSDFSWENIYSDWFDPSAQLRSTEQISATDCLVAAGTIYSASGTVDMQRLYVLPDVTWTPGNPPGDWSIVLRDAANAELLRHAFTPALADVEDFGDVFSFAELVPYVEGTVRVDIEGPGGLLHSVLSGAAPPMVRLNYPNGGETLTGDPQFVYWSGSDADGDTLSYNLQYSTDNGASWRLIASDVFSTGVWIDAANLPGATHARFRVLASDGIHTTGDVSDGAFIVPNHRPSVQILAPAEGSIYIVSQTVGLQAQVYDVEDGTLDAGHLRWYSTRDGIVGSGAQLSLGDLSAGLHTLVFVAVDSEGATDSDAVQIMVYAGPDYLPAMPDMLRADPPMVVLDPLMGASSRPLYVYNHSNPAPISWTAAASEPWLHLSAAAGSTPEVITVWASTLSLPEGPYTVTLTFANDAAPEDTATVYLHVVARRFPVYLPLLLKGSS
ncbi:MAG: DNRLRE domain-containing protein [Chloroflexia bacterium]|nr:DNRLRE domain-containing protein [Chloroflexia bacterium]